MAQTTDAQTLQLARGGRVATLRCPWPSCSTAVAAGGLLDAQDALMRHVRDRDAHPEEQTTYDALGPLYEAILAGQRRDHTAELAGLVFQLCSRQVLDGSYLVRVVDLCCGPGLVTGRLRRHGVGGPWWDVTGVDISASQLVAAAGRLDRVVVADASATGLPTGSADLVTCVYGWTDVPDWTAVVAEAHRLLIPGGLLVAAGTHPCFAGPDAVRHESGVWQVAGRYSRARRADTGAGFSPGGLRERVGAWHRSLGDLLAPLGEGWRLHPLREAGGDPPSLLGLAATREN